MRHLVYSAMLLPLALLVPAVRGGEPVGAVPAVANQLATPAATYATLQGGVNDASVIPIRRYHWDRYGHHYGRDWGYRSYGYHHWYPRHHGYYHGRPWAGYHPYRYHYYGGPYRGNYPYHRYGYYGPRFGFGFRF